MLEQAEAVAAEADSQYDADIAAWADHDNAPEMPDADADADEPDDDDDASAPPTNGQAPLL